MPDPAWTDMVDGTNVTYSTMEIYNWDGNQITSGRAAMWFLGLIKHYHSLAPLGQEARKPVFRLRSADGAIGAHQQAVRDAYGHFRELTERLLHVAGP